MPELAEVEYFRRQWDAGRNAAITEVLVHPKPKLFRGIDVPAMVRQLTGAHIVDSFTHGKQMFFRFRPAATLGIHLGMTGDLSIAAAAAPQGRHDHLVLRQKARSLVFSDSRMFGRIRFAAGSEKPEWETGLPPGILTPEFTAAFVDEALRRRGGTPVKAALLDQEFFPGIGNWMADEILWQAGIEPHRRCKALTAPERKRLHAATRAISKKSLEKIGKKLHDAPAKWLFHVRWRKGGDCPRCGAPLRHATIGGRTACWCPRCQPAK
jgi:formamidopyrimidine-DNA glycosylase